MIKQSFPGSYLTEPEHIPDFWLTQSKDIVEFINKTVKEGNVKELGKTAGNRPIYGVFYGEPRSVDESTTFNAALCASAKESFIGADSTKKVYMAIAGVHGSELEGIMGICNLISVFETGNDLSGKARPEINDLKEQMDRIILIPIVNQDGRDRIPHRMFSHYGKDKTIYQFWGTGAWDINQNIGYPDCKKHIPLDFSKTIFPGGYPNDNGVNIQHDDFFSENKQPETTLLFDLARKEKPNVILNLHTGVPYDNFTPFIGLPFIGKADIDYANKFITTCQEKLMTGILKPTEKIQLNNSRSQFNLNSALYFHSSSLTFTLEAPCHALSGIVNGKERSYSPEELLIMQLNAHQYAMKFLLS